MPLVTPVATFAGTEAELRGLLRRRKIPAKAAAALLEVLTQARATAEKGDLDQASRSMDSLHRQVARNAGGVLAPPDAEDVEVSVARLQRRIDLARAGVISLTTLTRPR
jgi:ATP/maltotriose-dependent transcriptional regulator MalT